MTPSGGSFLLLWKLGAIRENDCRLGLWAYCWALDWLCFLLAVQSQANDLSVSEPLCQREHSPLPGRGYSGTRSLAASAAPAPHWLFAESLHACFRSAGLPPQLLFMRPKFKL